jgi:hypothetical protein
MNSGLTPGPFWLGFKHAAADQLVVMVAILGNTMGPIHILSESIFIYSFLFYCPPYTSKGQINDTTK